MLRYSLFFGGRAALDWLLAEFIGKDRELDGKICRLPNY